MCIHCHGDQGEGYSNPGLPAPRLAGQADFYIFDALKSYREGTRGMDDSVGLQMKAVAAAIANEKDMKHLAAYVSGIELVGQSDLKNLSYKAYQGSWDKMPDLSQLSSFKSDVLPSGYIGIDMIELEKNYAVEFTADLMVSKDGEYQFELKSSDGSRLYLDGELVVDNDGLHGMVARSSKKLPLSRGVVELKLLYFNKASRKDGLNLQWNYNGGTYRSLSVGKAAQPFDPIPLAATSNEAFLIRNFFVQSSPRSIAVAYPEGVNLVFNASNMSLSYFWKGKFVDAGEMWKSRGTAFIYPQTDFIPVTNELQTAFLKTPETPWPSSMGRDAVKIQKSPLRFNGYSLDKKRFPTFRYSMGDARFDDVFTPIDNRGLKRTITCSTIEKVGQLWYRAAFDNIKKKDHAFVVNDEYMQEAGTTILRPKGDAFELLVPFQLKEDKAQVDVKYLFLN